VAHTEVVAVDRFGNAQLSLPGAEAHRAGLIPGAAVTLAWTGGEGGKGGEGGESREAVAPFVTAFGDVAQGELLCYRDSGDWVALAIAGGDAAGRLGLRPGTRVTLSGGATGGPEPQ
jgi:S-adenosylmethionine hydrolase